MFGFTKRCRSDDDTIGEKNVKRSNKAVQRIEMLPSTVERKAAITPTAISRRKVHTAHFKSNDVTASPS